MESGTPASALSDMSRMHSTLTVSAPSTGTCAVGAQPAATVVSAPRSGCPEQDHQSTMTVRTQRRVRTG